MKVTFIFVVCFFAFVVNSEAVFEKIIPNESVQRIENVNLEKRRVRSSATFVDDDTEDFLDGENEEQIETEVTCKERETSAGYEEVQFEVILPQSIRINEATKIDVMVYNNINSKTPVDVEVSMTDNCNGCMKFHFSISKCNSMFNNESNLTKTVSVPYGRSRYASFYTKNLKMENLKDIKLQLKAWISSINYQCSLIKSVKVEPIKVRNYEIIKRDYKLDFSRASKIEEISFRKETINKYMRISAEITSNRTTSSQTNLTATFTNENDFSKAIRVTGSNANIPIEITFPANTTTARVTLKGNGYCTIKFIIEKIVLIQYHKSQFNLMISTLPSSNINEEIVRVCATYQPKDDEESIQTLMNVIYDVEMPNGYVYKELIETTFVKHVEPRNKKSVVQIYFNNFIRNKQYCVDIRATKIAEVKDSVDAAVTVYDYEDKDNNNVQYYNFIGDCRSC